MPRLERRRLVQRSRQLYNELANLQDELARQPPKSDKADEIRGEITVVEAQLFAIQRKLTDHRQGAV